MSKERELLQKVLTKLNSYCYEGNVTIKNELIELLAQPEQSNEPVAWMYDWNIPVERNQEVLHAYKSRNHLTTDLTPILNDINDVENIRPLYLAPPEREPEQSSRWWYGKGVEDTKFFLTRKPLSEGELPTNNPKINTYGEILAFHTGIRWAEHQHGITGVDDANR